LLWIQLKGKRLAGFKFRRQHGVGPYILDFYCPEGKLAIEIDGASHDSDEARQRDQRRQAYVEEFGIRFVRFSDTELFENPNKILERIENELKRKEGGQGGGSVVRIYVAKKFPERFYEKCNTNNISFTSIIKRRKSSIRRIYFGC
jgi:very-short-patch-repair endonuclease